MLQEGKSLIKIGSIIYLVRKLFRPCFASQHFLHTLAHASYTEQRELRPRE
jgi:hypothetical protein